MEDPTIRLWGLPRSEAAASIKQRGPSKSDQEVVIGPDEYCMRASVYQKSGDLKRAFVVLTAALQLYPDHVDAYGLRGDILRATGHFGQAVEDYTHIIRMLPENSRAYKLRGAKSHAEWASRFPRFRNLLEWRLTLGGAADMHPHIGGCQ